MFRKSTPFYVCLALVGLFAGCLGPVQRRPAPPTPPPEVVEPPPVPEIPTILKGRLAAVWVPGPRVDALASAQYLAARPWVRLTAVFPERFFGEDEKSKAAKALFQTLVSSRQVEVALTLPGRPMMALLMDTDNARASVPPIGALPRAFAWPEDVMEQIGLAREVYRRRWRVAPTGVALPWDVALGPEFSLLAKFKLRWALLPSSGTVPSRFENFRLPVLRPAVFPAGPSPRREWIQSEIRPVLVASGTWGPFQVNVVEDLIALENAVGGVGSVDWRPLSEVLGEEDLSWIPPVTPPPVDFTPWIGDAEENRAWELLGVTRRAIEDYQNSGSANLRSLDLAKRAIHAAESGVFFEELGGERDTGREEDRKRDFLATLAQVYTLLGQPVPPQVRSGFARNGIAPPRGEDAQGGFEREGATLRWRDPANDDRGPGHYFYPTGPQFPTGAWDLLLFEVLPEDDQVTFSFSFTVLPNPGRAPGGFSLPLVDVYIDINRSPAAGSQDLLPGRPGLVEAVDAWEYVLTVDGWGARLQQPVPGQLPRVTAMPAVTKTGSTTFSVVVPRKHLRGDPSSWGFGVVVMGRSAKGGPMPVMPEPGPDRFGGSATGRAAPPYLDVLEGEGVSQRRVLDVYRNGQDITLPFVRAD